MEKKRIDIMIDLETASLEQNAAIFTISAVPFNLNGEISSLSEFDVVIDLSSCYMAGMSCYGCQSFWMDVDPAARKRIVDSPSKMNIAQAISEFYHYIESFSCEYDVFVWSRGSDFDFPKIEWCFKNILGKKPPYNYNRKRDVRTFVDDCPIDIQKLTKVGCEHRSLDDCINQIRSVQQVYNAIYKEAELSWNK